MSIGESKTCQILSELIVQLVFAEFKNIVWAEDCTIFQRVCDLPRERSISFGRGQAGRGLLQIHAQVELTNTNVASARATCG